MADVDKYDLISQFCSFSGTTPAKAQEFLEACDWNLHSAGDLYFASQPGEDGEEDASGDDPEPSSTLDSAGRVSSGEMHPSTGSLAPRTTTDLPSFPTPVPSTAPSSSSQEPKKPPQAKSRFGSLRDLQRRDEVNEADSDSDKEQEFFAGGDKSGLAVQDPSQSGSGGNEGGARAPGDARAQMDRLIRQAQRQQHTHDHAPPPSRSNFTGTARTLGGDDTPSQTIRNPSAPGAEAQQTVRRTLHLWRDGFSVDDGPLYRNDEASNQATLRLINQGQAPLSIMNVEAEQQVDVQLDPRMNEPYTAPRPVYKPFHDSGRRLGSPVPGEADAGPSIDTNSAVTASAPAPAQRHDTKNAAKESTDAKSAVAVDEAAPTLTLQVRLADGTRLPARFNTTHTVGDVYAFVERAGGAGAGAARPYALATTFPTRELGDRGVPLGDMKELGRGGVVVQKWT